MICIKTDIPAELNEINDELKKLYITATTQFVSTYLKLENFEMNL